MDKTVPVNMHPTQRLLKYVWSLYLYSRCCMWYDAWKHNFELFVAKKCLLFHNLLVSLESPDKPSVLVAVILVSKWPGLNRPKCQLYPLPKIQKNKFRGSCSPVGWASTSNPPSTENVVQVLSTARVKGPGAPSCMDHMCCHWWRSIPVKGFDKSRKKTDDTLYLSVCLVRLIS
jgi:hypothetical protein